MRDVVMLGEKCGRCATNRWLSYQTHLRCEKCGQVLWIVRYREDGGTRFRFGQGEKLPPRYKGWAQTTA